MRPSFKVSIIVNNYNYDRFLEAAVDSALAQSYHNTEVIVVDDGSTDRSREILNGYGNRIKLILKPNGGQSSAFNAGLAASTGDLISFLDSDDVLFPRAVETATSAWGGDAAKMQFPLEILGQDGHPTGLLMPRNLLSQGNVLPEYLQTGRYITSPTSGNLFSRKFLEQIFPIPEKEWAQTADGYINTCAPFYGDIGALHTPLGYYRIHGKSMSNISHGNSPDLNQIEKLIGHAIMEKTLLEKLARERGYYVPPDIVVGHWLHLKLKLAFYKLTDLPLFQRLTLLLSSASRMIISIAKAGELSTRRKLQNIAWVLGVIVLPGTAALPLIQYALNQSPSSFLARFLRRA